MNTKLNLKCCKIDLHLICILLIICVEAESLNNTLKKFKKCCLEDEVLVKYTNETTLVSSYECIHRDTTKVSYVSPEILVQTGYNGSLEGCHSSQLKEITVKSETQNQIDYCSDTILTSVKDGSMIPETTEVVLLGCGLKNTSHFSNPRDRLFPKCCQHGQAYDINGHFCRLSGSDDQDNLPRLFGMDMDNIDDYSFGLNCKQSEALTVFTELNFNILLDNDRLTLKTKLKESIVSEMKFLKNDYCVDVATDGILVAWGCTKNYSESTEIYKCCPVGQHFVPRTCGSTRPECVPNDGFPEHALNLTFYKGPHKYYRKALPPDIISFQFGLKCPGSRFFLNDSSPSDVHFLLLDGTLAAPRILDTIGTYSTNLYCLETYDHTSCGGEVSIETVMCLFPEMNNHNYKISMITLSISCVFMALTLLVYTVLPELRNLHGMTLICHVSCMLVAYCCLARVQYDRVQNEMLCKTLAYLIYCSFIAAFLWLNVMCFDMWRTFGSMQRMQSVRRGSAERRRFAWYSIYAWGLTLLFTTLTLLLDLYPLSPYLDANMGQHFCWFGLTFTMESNTPRYVLFVVPMGVLTCINLVLWVATARHCAKVKSEVHRMQAGSIGDRTKKRFLAERAHFVLTIRLWVVMGVCWVWELLSSLVTEPAWLWFAVDRVNELQGVSIFFILVFKPKVLYLVRKRLGLETGNKYDSRPGTRTSTTFLSRSVSSDERAQIKRCVSNPKIHNV